MTTTTRIQNVMGNGWIKLVLAVLAIVFAAGQVNQKIGDMGRKIGDMGGQMLAIEGRMRDSIEWTAARHNDMVLQGAHVAALQEAVNGIRQMHAEILADLRQIREFLHAKEPEKAGSE